MVPASAGYVFPQVIEIARIHAVVGSSKDERTRKQRLRIGVKGAIGSPWPLRKGHVPRGFHETTEACVGHRKPVNPEFIDTNSMDGLFLGIEVV